MSVLRRLIVACGIGWLGLGCGASSDTDPWNVLVLVPDTVRADHLSTNGYAQSTSPAIDALAKEGANFSQAITVAPRTWQSFSSILTGLYPPHHGVRYIFDTPIAAETAKIGTILSAHSYRTAAFDTAAFLEGMTGGKGFDTYVQPDPKRRDAPADAVLMEQVGEWIERHRQEPFLAFVRLPGAHWPYAPFETTEWCKGRDHTFNEGTYGIARDRKDGGVRLRDEQAFRKLIWNVDFDEDTRRHIIAHYDAEIRTTDALIGKLVTQLEELELLERTLIVVTSDHGESFGEHGYLQHGPRVDDAVMRVPLVVRLPQGHPAAKPGRRIDGLVRTVDILPTVLDALDVPVPEGLDGISLVPAIRGEPLPELWAYGETGRSFMGVDPERHFPGIAGKHRMIRTADWKLVHKPDAEGGQFLLYDLRADPSELRNVVTESPEAYVRLAAHLGRMLHEEGQLPALEMHPLSPEEIERLRELGYMQ